MKKSIITNIEELRKVCAKVEVRENISQIIQDLKDSLDKDKGFALTANQIGYNKSIAYCLIPFYNKDSKKIEDREVILINPKIIEKTRKIIYKGENCLSLPGLNGGKGVDTDRWVFVGIEYLNEKFEKQVELAQDLTAFIYQHEIDHCNGKTILDRKHKTR